MLEIQKNQIAKGVKALFKAAGEWRSYDMWNAGEDMPPADQEIYNNFRNICLKIYGEKHDNVDEAFRYMESTFLKVPKDYGDNVEQAIKKLIKISSNKGDPDSKSPNAGKLQNYVNYRVEKGDKNNTKIEYQVYTLKSTNAGYDYVVVFANSRLRTIVAADLLQQETAPRFE